MIAVNRLKTSNTSEKVNKYFLHQQIFIVRKYILHAGIYLHFGRDKFLQIRYLFIGLNLFPGPSAQNIYYLWRLS